MLLNIGDKTLKFTKFNFDLDLDLDIDLDLRYLLEYKYI